MDQIGRYRLEAELGRGGCGRVYRAFDPTVGRTVAVKLLITNTDKELLTRFRNEASASGKLHHRNIVTVYDFGEQDGTPYLVMEYLQGEDLHKLSARGHELSLIEKMSIMAQVAEGLHHAHQNGIVHRDVKPANIMVLSDGTVKIMDFGIARLLSQTGTRLTRDGAMIGTVSYMAPEQFQGGEIDALCDIWAYGLIYYELVTGHHPFNAPEPGIAIYNITAVEPPPVRAFVHDCPPALDEIIMRAIRKDRNLRYQSLEDVQFDVAPIRLELQRERAELLMISAEEKFSSKDVTGAQTIIREILDLDPSNAPARRLRETINREFEMRIIRERTAALQTAGAEELASEQYSKAMQTFESALRLDPRNTELQVLLQQAKDGIEKTSRAAVLLVQARHELRAHNLTNAYRSIMECLQNTPKSQQANDLLAVIQNEIELRDRERKLDEGLTEVDGLIRAEQYDDALRTLVDLEAAYPTSQKVKESLAAVHLRIEERLRRQRLEQGLEAARTLIRDRSWQRAIEHLACLRRDFPHANEIAPLAADAEAQLRAEQKAQDIKQIDEGVRALIDAHEFDNAIDKVDTGLRAYPDEAALQSLRVTVVEARAAHEREVGIRSAGEAVLSLLSAKRFDDADEEIDRAIESWDDPQLHTLKQQVATERQQYERAEAIVRISSEIRSLIRSDDVRQACDMAQAAVLEFGETPELKDIVADALAAKARKVDAAIHQAARLAQSYEFEQAIALLGETLGKFPDEPRLHTDALRLRIERLEHHRKRARQLISDEHLDEASQFLEDSLRYDPDDPALTEMLTSVRENIAARKRAEVINGALTQADKYARLGDLDSAVAVLSQLDETCRSDPRVAARTGEIRIERAVDEVVRQASKQKQELQFDAALKVIDRGLQDYPQHARLTAIRHETIADRDEHRRERNILATLQKASKLRSKGELESALRIIEGVLQSGPSDPRLVDELSSIRRELKRQTDLANIIRIAREFILAGNFDEAQKSLVDARTNYGDHRGITSAISDLQTAKRTAQIDACAATIQALLTSNLDEAAREIEEALRRFPHESKLLQARDRAREALDQRRRDGEVKARAIDASRLLDDGRVDEAIALLETANSEYPGYSEIVSLLDTAIEARKIQQRNRAIDSVVRQALDLTGSAKYGDAEQILLSAVTEHGSDERLIRLLTRARSEKQIAEEEQSIRDAIQAADALADRQCFSEASHMLIEALRIRANDSRLLEAQSRIEHHRKDHERTLRLASAIRSAREHLDHDRPNLAVSLLQPILHEANAGAEVKSLFRIAEARAGEQAREEQIRHIIEEAETASAQENYDVAVRSIEAGLKLFPAEQRLTTLLAKMNSLRVAERPDQVLSKAAGAAQEEAFVQDQIVEESIPTVPEQLEEHAELAPAGAIELTDPSRSAAAAAPSSALERPQAAVQPPADRNTFKASAPAPRFWRTRMAAALGLASVLVIGVAVFMRNTPPSGGLSVRTVPPDATIRIAGKACSQQPCRFDLPPGKHDLEVSAVGYRAIKKTVFLDRSNGELAFTLDPIPTKLQVVTNLNDGAVLLDGRAAGALKAGEFQLEPVPAGRHAVQVNSEDGVSALIRFEPVIGKLPQIEAAVEGKNVQTIAVSNLGPETRIVSTAHGSVTIDGRPVGQLTRDGLVVGNLGPGTHGLRVQAGRDTFDYVIATGDTPSVSVFLTANRDVGTLVVETREDDVRVFVNGERWPRSTQQGIVRINNLPVREHLIRVEKPGYKSPAAQRIAVGKGTLQRVSFRLDALPATLVLTGAMPQTEFLLDGRVLGTSRGNARFPVTPGDHVLGLSKDGYVPKEIRFRVEPGGAFNIAKSDLLLKEAPAPVKLQPQPPTIAEAPKPAEPPKTDDSRPPDVRDWEQVQASRDINRLEQFRKTYPRSPLSELATRRIEAVEWEDVRNSKDPKILQDFLARHPKTEHLDEARKRMEQFEWASVPHDNVESLRAFIRRFPAGDNAAEARSLLSKLDEAQEVAAIRHALERYASAMSAKDVDEVTRIWKNAPTRVLTDQFKILREISVQMRPLSWKIEGDRATVQCLRTSTAHLAAKPRPEPPRSDQATVTLRRQGAAWVIENLQVDRAR